MSVIYSMMDEKIRQAYINGDLVLSKGKITLDDHEITVLEMNRGEVISCNYERFMKAVKENEKNPKMNKGFASIAIFIQGWDDVPEPIYEIKEIRRFYQRLYRKMPHFLYYVAPIEKVPFYIIACLGDVEIKDRQGKFMSPMELVIKEGTTADIGSTLIEIRLSGEVGYKMIEEIQAHVETIKFEDKHEELPTVYSLIEKCIKKDERLNKFQ